MADRVERERVVRAATRLETVIALLLLTAARSEVAVTVGEQHGATHAMTDLLQSARVASAKVDLVLKRIP